MRQVCQLWGWTYRSFCVYYSWIRVRVWTICITHDFERSSAVWLKRIPEVRWKDTNIGL